MSPYHEGIDRGEETMSKKTSQKVTKVTEQVQKTEFQLSEAQNSFIETVGKTLSHMFELHAEQAPVIKNWMDSAKSGTSHLEAITEKGQNILNRIASGECDETDFNITGLIKSGAIKKVTVSAKVPEEVELAISALNGAADQFNELIAGGLVGYRPGKVSRKASGSTGVKGVAAHGNITDAWVKKYETELSSKGVSFRADPPAPGYNIAVRDDGKETKYNSNILRVWKIAFGNSTPPQATA